jgi:hypothetical protein
VNRPTRTFFVLRNGVRIEDPLRVVYGIVEAHSRLDLRDPSRPGVFDESNLRLANRGGARISAAEIALILDRRRPIDRALRSIPSDASLADAPNSVPWRPLRQLFDAFGNIKGVGFSKMTKALHPKRTALIPMLDSFVHKYLENDDPGAQAPFGERALALVKGYKRDLDRNRTALRLIRKELAALGHPLSEVRILDLLIWTTVTAP